MRIVLVDGQWTVDGYIIITVYLHKTPVTSSPWNIACYVMITVDRPSPSMIAGSKHSPVQFTPSASGAQSIVDAITYAQCMH